MSELMLITNPRKRGTRKRRTAAQKAATRKLVALNKRRRNPARRKTVAKVNPVRRHKRRASTTHARKVRRYKRNPSSRSIVNSTLIPALTAGAGAIGFNALWNFVPVPETFKTGMLQHVAKAVGAIGAGMLAGKVFGRKTATELTAGALTVVAYNALKDAVGQVAPSVNLGYYSAGQPAGVLAYKSASLGEYVGPGNGMGEYVPPGGGGYLANRTLAQPFAPRLPAGPGLETESQMGGYYN